MPVDITQAIDLKYNRHLSYDQIAAIQGVTRQAVHQRIKNLLPIPETQVFIDHRADIFAHKEMELLSDLTPAKVQKMGGRDLIVGAAILYDKERLERGKATEIIDYIGTSKKLQAIQAQLVALQKRREAIDLELGEAGVYAVDNPVNNNKSIDIK